MLAGEHDASGVLQRHPAPLLNQGAVAVGEWLRRHCGSGRNLAHVPGGDDLHATKFVARQQAHRLPRRDFQRNLQQVDRATHLDGVLGEPSDVALHQHEILGGVVGSRRIVAAIAKPYLVNQDACLDRHGALDAGQQHERAHRFAVSLRRDLGAALAVRGRRQFHSPAHRRAHAELAHQPAQRQSAKHRTAVRIQHHHDAVEVAVAGKSFEVARGVGRYGARRGDPGPAFRPARFHRPLKPRLELHRLRAQIGSDRRGRARAWKRTERNRTRADDESIHSKSPCIGALTRGSVLHVMQKADRLTLWNPTIGGADSGLVQIGHDVAASLHRSAPPDRSA